MNTVARKSALWLPLMLGALVLAVFSPSLEYEFAPLDDDVNVVYNPHHGPPGAAHSRWAFTDSTYIRRYQPLGWLALSSASLLSGLKPWGYHAVSVGQHAVNSLLLGWLLQALLRRSSTANIGFTQSLAPWLAAAWWALHPLRVEPVAWISAIPTHLALTFLLLALLIHVRAGPRISLIGGSAAFAASLLSYPVAIGAAMFFPLLDWTRGARGRQLIQRALPYAAVALAIGWVNLAARAGSGSEHAPMPSLEELSAPTRALRGFCFIVYYAWKPWLPLGLGPVYDDLLDLSWNSPLVFGSAAVAALLLIAVWRKPAAIPLLLAGVAVLLPITGVTELIHFPHDRYALWSDLVLVTGLAFLLARARRPHIAWLAGLLLAGAACLTLRQLPVWRSADSVTARLRHNLPPGKATVIRDIRPALRLFRDGDFAGAESLLTRELRERPEDPVLRSGLATLTRLRAEHDAMVRGLGLEPDQVPPAALLHHRLAWEFLRRSEPEPAAWHLAEIATLAPAYYSQLNQNSDAAR